jgi:hypothetical protein
VVSIDTDSVCIETLYRQAKADALDILPLVVDVANASPAIGWQNRERPSFLERMRDRFDCVLSLALLHHLAVKNRLSFGQVADLYAGLTKRYLLVEYISPSDAMFQRLVQFREESYSEYSRDDFLGAFAKTFSGLAECDLRDGSNHTDRTVYLMEKR